MSTIIKTRLIRIGNSHGVRIPKTIRDQVGLTDDIELEVQGSHLIIRPSAAPRATWAAQFQQMTGNGDDTLLDPETPTSWDESEWEWS